MFPITNAQEHKVDGSVDSCLSFSKIFSEKKKKRDDLANNFIFLFEFPCLDCSVSHFLESIERVFQKRGKNNDYFSVQQ